MATQAGGLISELPARSANASDISPVAPQQRRLRALDVAVLWGDLGIGLLVLVAGALLVPGLSLGEALAAIVVGSVLGSLLLALGGYIGARVGVPTMVLTRAALGIRGSYLPTALNVLQLMGWATFEIYIMATLAASITRTAVGLEAYAAWAAIFAVAATAMALWGPFVVVRQWLERFAVWVMAATSAYLFYYVFSTYDVAALLREPGTGALSFWAGVDLVIAMPLSWFPLVADYNRFARRPRSSFWATFGAYAVANFVFFALGALLARAIGAGPFELTGALVSALTALALGWLALLVVLVDETDQAFANVYSTAISLQNALSRVPQAALVVAVGAFALLLALLIDIAQYEIFLFLIGAFFVPLLGIVVADYFVVRRGYESSELYRPGGTYWYTGGLNIPAIAIWILGFAVYQWASPTPVPAWMDTLAAAARALGLPFPAAAQFGGSAPSFLFSFLAYSVLGSALARGRRPR